MKGKTLLSFLAGFALAAGAAFVLWRKERKKVPPSDAESKLTGSKPAETKPSRPLVSAQNPIAMSPNPFGEL